MQSGKPNLFVVIQQNPMLWLGVAAAILLLVGLSRIYWRYKIQKWADSQNMRLISFRGAWFFEGPTKFLRSRNQHVFRVIVEDSTGITHSAWLQFGTYWGFTWGIPLTDVKWDDDTDY